MDAYEKIIKTMRDEASKEINMPSFGFAEMTSEKSLIYNGLDFDEDDVIFADYLLSPPVRKVDFEITQEQTYHETHHNHGWTDKSKNVEKLRAGDTVFGIMVDYDEDEKFLVLCRIGGL